MENKKCFYHNDRPAETSCVGCGRPLCADHPIARNGSGRTCLRCAASEAAGDVLADEVSRSEERFAAQNAVDEKRRKRTLLLMMITAICGLVILYQALTIGIFFRPEPVPYRLGTAETDEKADGCIRNLWEMSRAMQAGTLAPEGWTCPACGLPYVIDETAGQTVVRCPCPLAHGLTRLGFSRNAPVPEAVP